MTNDGGRRDLIRDFLRESKLDALVCTLPADVLLLTGYWPVVGTAVAVAPRDGRIIALVPEDEHELAKDGWADEIRTFAPASLDDLHTPAEAVAGPLAAVGRSLAAGGLSVGFEGGASEPASYAAMHLYGSLIVELLAGAFPGAYLVPVTEGLARLRALKTPLEIERIRTACRAAGDAFREGSSLLRPKLRETQAANRFRGPLFAPGGDPPPEGRHGGFMWCMSGPNSAGAHGAYARSRPRRIAAGEFILVHCNSYADGYWTDVTRTYCLGEPDRRMREIIAAVFEARAAAIDQLRPGATGASADRAARSVLRERGFGVEFKHSTGHGVGFGAISPQARPRLHPKSDDVLRPGMVFNVEPAVYVAGWGGMRHCDVFALRENGPELLTPFQAAPDDLLLPLPAAAAAW